MRKKHAKQPPRPQKQEKPRKSRSKSKEKTLTTEDVTKTYTGLDRTIAEEFIEICDSRNTSLCSNSSTSESSQSSACRCQHPCSGCAKKCMKEQESDKKSDRDSVKK